MRLKTVILLACLCVLTLGTQTAFAQFGPAIGNITSAGSTCSTTSTPTNCVTLKLDASSGAATILITNTFVGTAQFEVSNDGESTWTNINCTPPNSTTAVTSATAVGAWQCNVAGFTGIRVRGSAYTSGTVSVVINSAHASAKSGGGTSLPALSDNGTNVISTEAYFAPNGTASLPAYSFTNSTGTGMYETGNLLGLVTGASSSEWLALSNGGANLGIQIGSTSWLGWNSGTTIFSGATDLAIRRGAAASLVQGLANSASPIAQTFTLGESSRGGTDSNVAGASGTLKPGIGTGLGAGTKFCIQRDIMGATGSTAQSTIDGYCVGPSKTLSNTSATAQSLVNVSVPSNSAGGVEGTITITCTDGTNFDAETQSFNTSFVNKAGAMTVTSPVITATTAANNSGSCTAGITAVAGTNSVDIKVTPVLTTIVPTTVTSYITLRNNGTGNATFN